MRRIFSAALTLLIALLVPLSALSVWASLEVGDTGRYVATMAPLAGDAAVQNAVADRVTEQVMKNIDVGPMQSSVDDLVRQAVKSFAGSDAFRAAWNTVNEVAHTAVEKALTSDNGDDAVIDLAPVTERVKQELTDQGVPLASRIPVEHTQVTVLTSEQLGDLRDGYRRLRTAGFWLPAATLVLAALALLLAVRRRRAVAWLGLATALGGVLLLVAVAVARPLVLDGLPADVDRAAAGAVYDALTGFLRTAGWVALGLGLAAVLAAWLTGWLRRHRRPPAETLRPPDRAHLTA
ncbi:hypothetical protein [Streptomyces beijiangensis]|uniref:Integral membrane protein n=1 Tax=Streptomyces beijiangensis TaxID=163361 RepID=A0A939FEX5_9ACTN|nr:hypothetical protein [Streptomyces beijiangensis]MBO0515790.1 hypothetical protein [Streptomyces beijiangensis]